MNAVLLHMARYRSAHRHLDRVEHEPRSRSHQINYRVNLDSRRPAPDQAFCHLLGTGWRGRWCGATPDVKGGEPPDLPRPSGRLEAFSRASRGGEATRGPWISGRRLVGSTSVVASKTTEE